MNVSHETTTKLFHPQVFLTFKQEKLSKKVPYMNVFVSLNEWASFLRDELNCSIMTDVHSNRIESDLLDSGQKTIL